MAMGERRCRARQKTMWVASAGHPFYVRLNRVLDDTGFDAFVEAQGAHPRHVPIGARGLDVPGSTQAS